MRYEVKPIQVDYTKAQYPVPVAEPVAPKQDDFQPTLTMYLHDDANVLEWSVVPRKAVVVIPGGGYRHVSEREGEPIASFLFAAGMQVFVLRYSTVPNVFPAALMELAESMRFVRSHAEEFHINPEKIAVMGFSAGGHLAANLATMYGEKFLLDSIGATEEEIKPNAQLLIYPVISSGDFAHRNSFKNLCGTMEELQPVLSLENLVTENTPPAFMVAAWNDPLVPVRNSLVYADALAQKNVSCELHIYKEGWHGFALMNNETRKDLSPEEVAATEYEPGRRHTANWVEECKEWIKLF